MIKVLFVCLGNICRSPMAEFMLKKMVEEKGIEKQFYIESAGTSLEEEGNDMYGPAKRKLDNENVPYTQRKARRITLKDYEKFDFIIGMEQRNCEAIRRIVREDYNNKIYRLLDFTSNSKDIADPWYTGDFDKTYEEILKGIESFLTFLQNNDFLQFRGEK